MAGNKNSGRPPFEPTEDQREKVRVCKAGGMSNEAIAIALGIAPHTLTKHFFADVELGAAKVTAEILMARYHSAKAGNVAAQNRLLETAGALPPKPAKPAPRVPAKGKKEILDEEAQVSRASPGWGDVLQ
jgi:hypothetical protein